MRMPARTLIANALYLFAAGLGLVMAPEAVARLLGVAGEPYLTRIIGLLMLCFAAYDVLLARHADRALIAATVTMRTCLGAALVLFVMADLAPAPILLFALAAFVGAAATALALRGGSTLVPPMPAR